jgi:hypothetical protein
LRGLGLVAAWPVLESRLASGSLRGDVTTATPTAPALASTPVPALTLAGDYPVQPVPFTAVQVKDEFWAPRLETNRAVTIPYAFQKCEETGRVDNFERAAAALRGEKLANTSPPGYPFDDTDIYKVIEGASYALSVQPDPKLEAYVDGLIVKIAAAQEPDGYLYTARTINPAHPHAWSGPERWVYEEQASHELYDQGHLYESAVAYYQATGKRAYLDIALKSANLLDATFGPGKRVVYPGHQIVEMGLVKLYRVTGDERYLKLAEFFLQSRGPGPNSRGSQYNQSYKPVLEQTEAVGHAVRATYMYSGMADVAALTSDPAYVQAIDKIWDNAAGKKIYVTGGIGATSKGEAFGRNYQLPNASAYCETCAAVGNAFWNQRLFLLHADGKYVDVLERIMYNGLLSGVALEGRSFFYPNPLASDGKLTRSPWFGCACCPGNITRFLPSMPGYVYAHTGDTVYANLFAAGTATIPLADGRVVKLTQETRYPWDGAVKFTVADAPPGGFTLKVRIPGWARGEAIPGGLYNFTDQNNEPVSLKVNGQLAPLALDKGYVTLTRAWQPGDVVELSLPMPARRVTAEALVAADTGRVAVQRGPVVYCAEWPDNSPGPVAGVVLPDAAQLSATFRPDLLGGVTVVRGQGSVSATDAQGHATQQPQDLTLIPYYAWANRGQGEMEVWLRQTPPA